MGFLIGYGRWCHRLAQPLPKAQVALPLLAMGVDYSEFHDLLLELRFLDQLGLHLLEDESPLNRSDAQILFARPSELGSQAREDNLVREDLPVSPLLFIQISFREVLVGGQSLECSSLVSGAVMKKKAQSRSMASLMAPSTALKPFSCSTSGNIPAASPGLT